MPDQPAVIENVHWNEKLAERCKELTATVAAVTEGNLLCLSTRHNAIVLRNYLKAHNSVNADLIAATVQIEEQCTLQSDKFEAWLSKNTAKLTAMTNTLLGE